ncbi:MAG: DUF3048 domain-containing protein [Defluviitaleaceae bacterium]|nr:DUF3048 domain-containing protein [Defluviitaleaceae bacterium]
MSFLNRINKKILIPIIVAVLIAIAGVIIFVLTRDDYVPEEPQEIYEPEIEIPTEPEDEEDEEEPEDIRPLGRLTGLPIDEEYLNRRPIAVTVNNAGPAWPHSGLLDADIIYEILIELPATRLVAVFQSEMPERVGPIRSTRDFFSGMVLNHDAILVHHGGTDSGYISVRDLPIVNIDGMQYDGTIFWRDRSYPQWTGRTGQRAFEHSSFSSWENLSRHIEARNIRDYINEEGDFGLNFGEIPEHIAPISNAERVTVPFTASYTRHFIFDDENGHYMVENRDGAHRDAETQEQLFVNNVLIMITPRHGVDMNGFASGTIVGEGIGYLATNGELFAVQWEKANHISPTQWFFEDGTPLALTSGKTWICVFQNTGTLNIE